jgi:hypothetical protein
LEKDTWEGIESENEVISMVNCTPNSEDGQKADAEGNMDILGIYHLANMPLINTDMLLHKISNGI